MRQLSAAVVLAGLLGLPIGAVAQQPGPQNTPAPAPSVPRPSPPTAPSPVAPAPTPVIAPRPDPKKAELDNLLNGLKAAPSDEAAAALEERIRQRWIDAGSPAASLLMHKGLRNLQAQSGDDAVGDFDAVLVLEPNLQAAFTYRARARFLTGDYSGALRDTQAALAREPRNFVALQGLSHIAESRGDLKGALQAWQKLLELDPKTPDADKRLRELSRKVNGETT